MTIPAQPEQHEKEIMRASEPSDAGERQDLREVRNETAPHECLCVVSCDGERHVRFCVICDEEWGSEPCPEAGTW